MIGRIHSIETLGALDGPGMRCVVFMQGCPLRCLYCHNPDTWDAAGGTEMSTGEVMARVERCRPYFGAAGGLTLSGGEPLMQAEFVLELLRLCRAAGVHTALDTSGAILNDTVRKCLREVGLVILDVKHANTDGHRRLTGVGLDATLAFLRECGAAGVRMWVRQVIVPGLNDTPADAESLAKMLRDVPRLERVELLPYHRMGLDKYRRLGLECPLADTPEPSEKAMAELQAIVDKAMNRESRIASPE